MQRAEIERILPHRGRALLLDEVTFDLERNLTIGYLTVREEHCEGHFPDNPIMRGVDRIEMIALTLGIAAQGKFPEGSVSYLVGVDGVSFKNIAYLGDRVRTEVQITKKTRKIIQGNGKAFVGENIVAEVKEIRCIIKIA